MSTIVSPSLSLLPHGSELVAIKQSINHLEEQIDAVEREIIEAKKARDACPEGSELRHEGTIELQRLSKKEQQLRDEKAQLRDELKRKEQGVDTVELLEEKTQQPPPPPHSMNAPSVERMTNDFDASSPRPVPVSQLASFPLVRVPYIDVDATRKLLIQIRPSCPMILVMMALPFCMGCCMFKSVDLLFDDVKRTLRISSWNGFCCCCAGNPSVVRYEDIANLVLNETHAGRRHEYEIYLVTNQGQFHGISNIGLLGELEPTILSYHRFLFGRTNPANYQRPLVQDLIRRV